jgi:hypothetical protein
MKTIWILSGLLLASTSVSAQIVPGEPFNMGIGDVREIEAFGLVLEFEELLHDSRCPRTVTCVWEGVAELHVLVEAPPLPQERLLLATETGNPDIHPTSADYGALVVRLLELAPYPFTVDPIDPSLYVATFVVEQRSVPTEVRAWTALKSRYVD